MDRRGLAELFGSFFKIGLFTVGGGYAMIPMIEDCCVDEKGWMTHDEMMDITVIAESTPGPIAINCATYVGYRRGGIWGALAATIGVSLPSFIIIFVISRFFEHFLEYKPIASAFKGIKIAVKIVLLEEAIHMFKLMPRRPLQWGLAAAAFLIMLAADVIGLSVSSIILLAAGGLVSLAVFSVGQRKKEGDR